MEMLLKAVDAVACLGVLFVIVGAFRKLLAPIEGVRPDAARLADQTNFGTPNIIDESDPPFNIDGTPMFGPFDMNGNPYGSSGRHFDD
jgi:hypothetical protein